MNITVNTDFYDIHDRHYAENVMLEVHAHWNGHEVDLGERTELEERVSQQFLDVLFSIDPESEDFEQRYHYYLNIGALLEEEGLLPQLDLDGDQSLLDQQFGLGKNLARIWKKHKKVLIVVAVAVIVIAVTAGLGAAATAAGAGGAGISIDDRRRRESTTLLDSDPTAASLANPTKPLPLFTGVSQLPELLDKSYQPLSYSYVQSLSSSEYMASLREEIPHLYKPPTYLQPPQKQEMFGFGRTSTYQSAFDPDPVPSAFSFGGNRSHFLSEKSSKIGERALLEGNFETALYSFEKAIQFNPDNSSAYINKGIAHLGLGEYEEAFQHYEQLTPKKSYPLEYSEFAMGFSNGQMKGIGLSFKGALELLEGVGSAMMQVAISPREAGCKAYQSCAQTYEAFGQLYHIAQTEGLAKLSEILVPEVYQLVTEWDTIPSKERGERCGTILTKFATDILLPGSIAKGANLTVKAGKELNTVIKNLRTAQRAFFLETTTAEFSFANGFYKSGPIVEEFGVGTQGVRLGGNVGAAEKAFGQGIEIKEFASLNPCNIQIKNINAAHHILQEKHCWHKLIKVTGNVKEDFKSVQKLLEESKIFEKQFLIKNPLPFPEKAPKIIRSVHELEFKGETIQAIFEQNIETGAVFLQNAFVLNPK